MKIRLLAVIGFAVLQIVFFCGCGCLNETNAQHISNEVEKTYSSASDIADESTVSLVKEEPSAESVDTTQGEQVIESTLQTVNSTESEADSEPSEIYTENLAETTQGEPEINFSDLM